MCLAVRDRILEREENIGKQGTLQFGVIPVPLDLVPEAE